MVSRFHLELIFAGFVFVVGLVMLIGSRELSTAWAADGPQAGFFPLRVGLILCGASMLVAAIALRQRKDLSASAMLDGPGARRVIGFGVPIVAMVAVAQWLGLYVAMALYLAGTIRFAGRRSWVTSLLVAITVTLVAWVVFEIWFKVPLLKGPLERALNLG